MCHCIRLSYPNQQLQYQCSECYHKAVNTIETYPYQHVNVCMALDTYVETVFDKRQTYCECNSVRIIMSKTFP